MREGQRAQERAFDNGEDRSICTDTERKCQDSDESKPRRFANLAKSKSNIVHKHVGLSL